VSVDTTAQSPVGTSANGRNFTTAKPSSRPPRPPKDAAKLTRQFNVRLPDREYKALVAAARKSGLKHSSVVRGLIEKFLQGA
jgi:predicted HicB family RNase H-like nuclease